MPVDLIVGALFGDEGKGKIASFIAFDQRPSIMVRTGAINAGHTVYYRGREYKLRALPSGLVTHRDAVGAVAPGALISIDVLKREVEELGLSKGSVWVDERTGIITEEHIERERSDANLSKKIGSTLTGVGAAMSDRVLRKLKLARDYRDEIEKFALSWTSLNCFTRRLTV